MTTATRQLAWLPDTRTRTQAVRCGVAWDAVRVPADRGEAVLRQLGDNGGALIEDLWGRLMYWLIPPGTADAWPVPSDTKVLGRTSWLIVPGLLCHGATHWRIRPDRVDDYLTDPELLRAALTDGGGKP